MILKPFFRYYGGKWRAVHAGRYAYTRKSGRTYRKCRVCHLNRGKD